MQGGWAYLKAPNNLEIYQRVRPCGVTLCQKVLGTAFPPPWIDWREILHGQADPRATRLCQVSHESVQRVASTRRKYWFSAC